MYSSFKPPGDVDDERDLLHYPTSSNNPFTGVQDNDLPDAVYEDAERREEHAGDSNYARGQQGHHSRFVEHLPSHDQAASEDDRDAPPQWQLPIQYDFERSPRQAPVPPRPAAAPGPNARYASPGPDSRANYGPAYDASPRSSLRNTYPRGQPDDVDQRYSLSSYQHPYEIEPPAAAHPINGAHIARPASVTRRSALRRSVSFVDSPKLNQYDVDDIESQDNRAEVDEAESRPSKTRGLTTYMRELYALRDDDPEKGHYGGSGDDEENMRRRPRYQSQASFVSNNSDYEGLDPDDPIVTGKKANQLEDPEDVRKHTLRQMDYRTRRKHLQRIKIEFNISCE